MTARRAEMAVLEQKVTVVCPDHQAEVAVRDVMEHQVLKVILVRPVVTVHVDLTAGRVVLEPRGNEDCQVSLDHQAEPVHQERKVTVVPMVEMVQKATEDYLGVTEAPALQAEMEVTAPLVFLVVVAKRERWVPLDSLDFVEKMDLMVLQAAPVQRAVMVPTARKEMLASLDLMAVPEPVVKMVETEAPGPREIQALLVARVLVAALVLLAPRVNLADPVCQDSRVLKETLDPSDSLANLAKTAYPAAPEHQAQMGAPV